MTEGILLELVMGMFSLIAVLVAGWLAYKNSKRDQLFEKEQKKLELSFEKERGERERIFEERLEALRLEQTKEIEMATAGLRIQDEVDDNVFRRAEATMERYEKQVSELTQQIEELRERVAELEDAIVSQGKEYIELRDEHDRNLTIIATLKAEKAGLEKSNLELRAKADDAAASQAEKAGMQTRISTLINEVADLKILLRKTEEERDEASLSIGKEDSELAERLREVMLERDRAVSMADKFRGFKDAAESAKSREAELSASILSLRKQIKDVERKLDIEHNASEKYRQAKESLEAVDGKRIADYNRLKEENKKLRSKIDEKAPAPITKSKILSNTGRPKQADLEGSHDLGIHDNSRKEISIPIITRPSTPVVMNTDPDDVIASHHKPKPKVKDLFNQPSYPETRPGLTERQMEGKKRMERLKSRSRNNVKGLGG